MPEPETDYPFEASLCHLPAGDWLALRDQMPAGEALYYLGARSYLVKKAEGLREMKALVQDMKRRMR